MRTASFYWAQIMNEIMNCYYCDLAAISSNIRYSRDLEAISAISGYNCDLSAFNGNTRYNCDFSQ
jgi:hypothetical protein